ncbi:LCP family glycopolymer transferase [Streptomyces sp. URMC 123]|uniref:LCP family protein n=1 Tax=Streptomyces sp. URMC 123 TaxID=3423403 RepID=UPI003F19E530
MDAQGRGRAGDIDPADQWVFNPETGSYELRLDPGAEQPGHRSAAPPGQRGSSPAEPRSAGSRSAGSRSAEPRVTGRTRRTTGTANTSGLASTAHTSGTFSGAGPASTNGTTGGGPTTRRPVPGQRRRSGGRPGAQPPPTSRRKPKPRKSGKKKALYWTSGVLGFVLIAGCTTAYLVYDHLNSNINKVDVGIRNSATIKGPVNILVIGTDTREGQDGKYGDAGSVGHADTTLLFHVSEDRTNATALSIPRDMITNIPDCPVKQPDGSTKVIPGQQNVRFNTSLGQEGRDPGCTWRTVEQLAGVKIHHFMMADFNAVKTLSSAIGGVDVCVAKDINDPKSHLKLSKGRHTVQGEDALAFVRTRYSTGFGSDLDRIKLQQQFLSSMIRKMKSGDTLTSPTKLYGLANSATKALTVDSGIESVKDLAALAKDLSRVDLKHITFATVPVVDNTDGATVVLDKAKSQPLFSMIQQDVSLTEVKRKEKEKEQQAKDQQEALLKGPKSAASEVRVKVLNGSGKFGAAQETVDWLQNGQGVARSSNGGNAGHLDKTILEFAPNQADQARRLAEMMGLPASALRQGNQQAAPRAEMSLTLGGDYQGAGTPITAPQKAPEGIQKVEADDENLCAK